jgi:acetyl esterase/lipase
MRRRGIAAILATLVACAAPAAARAHDIVVPAQGHERGSVLLFHQGAWLGGDTSQEEQTARALSRAGWRAVSVDYPLRDVAASYRSARSEARRHRRAGRPLVAVGESVGGTIAEWLAAWHWVDAAAAIAAPADFRTWPLIQAGGAWQDWPGQVGLAGRRWQLSPARVYNAQTSAPLIVYHSLGDEIVDPGQAREMIDRGARRVWLRGSHLVDQRWRTSLARRLLRLTTRP